MAHGAARCTRPLKKMSCLIQIVFIPSADYALMSL